MLLLAVTVKWRCLTLRTQVKISLETTVLSICTVIRVLREHSRLLPKSQLILTPQPTQTEWQRNRWYAITGSMDYDQLVSFRLDKIQVDTVREDNAEIQQDIWKWGNDLEVTTRAVIEETKLRGNEFQVEPVKIQRGILFAPKNIEKKAQKPMKCWGESFWTLGISSTWNWRKTTKLAQTSSNLRRNQHMRKSTRISRATLITCYTSSNSQNRCVTTSLSWLTPSKSSWQSSRNRIR